MTRDLALIGLAALLCVVAMVCATALVVIGHAPPTAGFGVITGAIGIGGVALGRLTGAPATGGA